jgi:redox-sensitive bicupin YhaK (pirin superfamily)
VSFSIECWARLAEVEQMSNVETHPRESVVCVAGVPAQSQPVRDLLYGHSVALGGPRGFEVTRTLPNRERRMVGAWCFADSYGPHDVSAGGMRITAHPHIGLQTVTWLVAGEVMHRDSLNSEQLIRPGQLNLMTAGHGISHAEVSPPERSRWLHGVQLWVALPSSARETAPAFEHHPSLPAFSAPGLSATVVLGTLGGVTSPATTYTPIVGAELALAEGVSVSLPLRPDFEYAMLALSGTAIVDGVELKNGPILYLGSGRNSLPLNSSEGGRLLLLGGEPFEEQLVMWWNFVGRSHEDIVAARTQWMTRPGSSSETGWLPSSAEGPATERFGTVPGPEGDPMLAPAMPGTRLRPRGRER